MMRNAQFGRLRWDSAVTSSLIAFCIKAASAGLAFVMFASLAQVMTLASYGAFAALFSLALIAAAAGSFGQKANVVRFAAAYDEMGAHALRRGVIRFGYIGVFTVSLLAGGISAGIAVNFLGWEPTVTSVSLVIVLTLAIALSDFQTCAIRVNSGPILSLTPRDVFWRVLVIGGAAVLPTFILDANHRPELWGWVTATTLMLAVLLQLGAFHAAFPNKSFWGPARMKTRFWIRQSLGPWASNLVVTTSENLGVIVIGGAVSVEQAAPYFAALRISQLLNLFLVASEVVVSPLISRAIANDDRAAVQRTCSANAILASLFAALGFFVLVVFGPYLLGFFGRGFQAAYPELLILAGGFVVNTVCGPTVPLLQMYGHSGQLARFQFFANCLSVVLMVLFVPLYGPMGAAVSVALAQVIWNCASWIYARRVLGVDPTVFSLLSRPKPLAYGGRGT